MKSIIFLSVSMLLSTASFSQTGTIKGSIKTSDGQAAEYVSVGLTGTNKGTSANGKGEYEIRNVQPGMYTLKTSFIGLETLEQQVEVKANETTIVPDIILKENSQTLKEVVVSASSNKYKSDNPSQTLRMNTPILEAPQNIQVITKEVLNDQQSFDMLDGVQRNISGAQKVEHWDNYARINMRGSQLTSFRNGLNVQLSPWSPLTEDMSMVERIEFVKGPAGFMLANGQPGGFYNVVTKKPSGFEKGEVTFSLGSYETYRVTTDLDGKLSKNGKVLYRLNMMGQLKGSHRDYEYNNRYSFAPVIKYLIDDKSSVTFEYNEQFSQMSIIGSNYAFSKRKYADLPANFTTAEPNLKPTDMQDRSLLTTFEHKLSDNWKFTAQAAYLHYRQIGQSMWPWSISSVNDSLMQRGIGVWDALGFNKNGQMFINGKVTTKNIVHNILAGVDMSHRDYYADWMQYAALGDSTFNIYDPQYGTIASADIPQWDRSLDIRERGVRYNNSYAGMYLQDELGLFKNKLRLTLAGRYTTNNYINPYSGTTHDGKFTPRTGLSWSITKNTTTYLLYDQVFLGNPGTDWQGKNFAPVTGDNMEWGIKKDWFDGKWNSIISMYQITKNNMLTADLEHPDPNSGQFIYSKQTGQQQVKGVEVDVRGEIVKNLAVIINYAYTDARITKDTDPEVIGNRVAGATTHIHNTWLNYKIGNGALSGLKFSIGYQYQAGRTSWFVWDNTEQGLPDYFRLDGGIGYSKEKFSVNVLVNNILDEYLYSGAPYGGMYYWQTEPGRNIRMTIAYRF